MDAVPLKSEKGVDYTRLRDLLKSGQWKEADLETGKLMERVLGTSSWYKIYKEKLLLKFPCADLKTIDQLWVRASQGRYGFSVQKEIYVKCGAKPDGNYPGDTIWYKFCNEVGWRVKNSWVSYGDLDWGGTGVPGHLPGRFGVFVMVSSGGVRVGGCVVACLLSHRDL
ncbi:MAG: GUN4 domain-containing protein [Prochlorothrix sp.]